MLSSNIIHISITDILLLWWCHVIPRLGKGHPNTWITERSIDMRKKCQKTVRSAFMLEKTKWSLYLLFSNILKHFCIATMWESKTNRRNKRNKSHHWVVIFFNIRSKTIYSLRANCSLSVCSFILVSYLQAWLIVSPFWEWPMQHWILNLLSSAHARDIQMC